MARAPSSEGKTRLAPHLSASQLASLRAALLADTLLVLEPLSAVTVFFTPDEAEQEIAALSSPAIDRKPQGDGDLGARMLRALRHLIGADGGAARGARSSERMAPPPRSSSAPTSRCLASIICARRPTHWKRAAASCSVP